MKKLQITSCLVLLLAIALPANGMMGKENPVALIHFQKVCAITSSILIDKMIRGEADFTLTTCLEKQFLAGNFPKMSELTDEQICTTILNATAAVSNMNEALHPHVLLRDTLVFIKKNLGRTVVTESYKKAIAAEKTAHKEIQIQIEQICRTLASQPLESTEDDVATELIAELKKFFPSDEIDLNDYLIYQALRNGLEMFSGPEDLEQPYVTAAIKKINPSFNKQINSSILVERFAKELKGNPTGLVNNRSMCYQNSVTQALRWCGPLNALLMYRIARSDYPLVASFAGVMAELNNPTLDHAYDPKKFSDIARHSFFADSADRQQDAQEFLMRFLQNLHSLKVLTNDKTNGISTHSSLTCTTCLASRRSRQEDPTHQLQLNLMDSVPFGNEGPISIDQLLANYTRKELTVAGEEICCPAVTASHHAEAKTPHEKSNGFTINAVQPFAVLHIGRFYQDRPTGNNIKIANPVIFAENGIVKIADSTRTIHRFRIASAVVHVGSTINQGHYYTISWNGVYNDTHVHLDDGHSMRQFLTHGYHQNKGANEAQGYLYFLERI